MTSEEYKERKEAMLNRHRKELNGLAVEYCKAINPYKIGDVFQDHLGKIRIEKMIITGIDHPSLRYIGPELKNDGTDKKLIRLRDAYLLNDTKSKPKD